MTRLRTIIVALAVPLLVLTAACGPDEEETAKQADAVHAKCVDDVAGPADASIERVAEAYIWDHQLYGKKTKAPKPLYQQSKPVPMAKMDDQQKSAYNTWKRDAAFTKTALLLGDLADAAEPFKDKLVDACEADQQGEAKRAECERAITGATDAVVAVAEKWRNDASQKTAKGLVDHVAADRKARTARQVNGCAKGGQ